MQRTVEQVCTKSIVQSWKSEKNYWYHAYVCIYFCLLWRSFSRDHKSGYEKANIVIGVIKSLPTTSLWNHPNYPPTVFFFSLHHPYAFPGIENSSLRRAKGEIPYDQRLSIIYAYQAGVSQSKLSIDFRCTRKTIFNTIQRFKQHNAIESLLVAVV